jgi:hypothetical protein
MKKARLLFTDEMVRANLTGLKSQTRRLYNGGSLKKYGYRGNHLVVKEATRIRSIESMGTFSELEVGLEYRADLSQLKLRPHSINALEVSSRMDFWVKTRAKIASAKGLHWVPNMFMPDWAARLEFRITETPFSQHLQEITEADALREGIRTLPRFDHLDPVSAYMALWDEINGQGHHQTNPLVVVISYEKII